jgi:hypothetical protein
VAAVDPEGLQRVYNDFMADPEIAPEFLKLYQKKYPKARVPELETLKQVEHSVNPKIEALEKENKEIREQLLQDRVQKTIQANRDKLTNPPWNLSDAEIESVEKIAAEEGVSLDSAAQLYAYRSSGSAGGLAPSGFTPKAPRRHQSEDWRKELKNPDSPLFKDTDNYLAAKRAEIMKEIGPFKSPT